MKNNEFKMSTGQAHEVAQALGRSGWTNEQVKHLSEGDFLENVLDVLLGHAEIRAIEHLIDLGADVFLPNRWSLEEHQKGKVSKLERKGDNLYLDGKKIEFWFSDEQKKRFITGNVIRAELKGKRVLSANLSEYLLNNQHLIPEAWKYDENGKIRYIFFWGTIYRDVYGNFCVCYLHWNGEKWVRRYYMINNEFDKHFFSAVLAS